MSSKHTPGPWAWFGNAGSNSLYLGTTHSGRRFVMDFVRWGFSSAQPRFQPSKGVMVEAKHLLQFAVGDHSIVGIEAARKDTSVYRLDVRGVDCADARLIAAAPELLEALKVLAEEADNFSVSGVYFNEPCMGHTGLELARAAIAKAEGGAS